LATTPALTLTNEVTRVIGIGRSDRSEASAAVLATAATKQLSVLHTVAGAVAFAALTFVGAHIYVPLQPVPVTMQTLFVLLAGAAIGGRIGGLSQLLYVGIGAAGLPVFAGGTAGIGVLAGPTGGYLASFVVAPLVVSALIRRSGSIAGQTGAFVAGTMVVFVMGVSHLAAVYTHDLASALRFGLLPFIPGALVKIAAAVGIYRAGAAFSAGIRARTAKRPA